MEFINNILHSRLIFINNLGFKSQYNAEVVQWLEF